MRGHHPGLGGYHVGGVNQVSVEERGSFYQVGQHARPTKSTFDLSEVINALPDLPRHALVDALDHLVQAQARVGARSLRPRQNTVPPRRGLAESAMLPQDPRRQMERQVERQDGRGERSLHRPRHQPNDVDGVVNIGQAPVAPRYESAKGRRKASSWHRRGMAARRADE